MAIINLEFANYREAHDPATIVVALGSFAGAQLAAAENRVLDLAREEAGPEGRLLVGVYNAHQSQTAYNCARRLPAPRLSLNERYVRLDADPRVDDVYAFRAGTLKASSWLLLNTFQPDTFLNPQLPPPLGIFGETILQYRTRRNHRVAVKHVDSQGRLRG
jgi:hypothetical protein